MHSGTLRCRSTARGGGLAILHNLTLAAEFGNHADVVAVGLNHTQGAAESVCTPPSIHDLFEWPVCVLAHPTQSCPLIVPEPNSL